MSLINKMLQDLDARGGTKARDATGEVRPVAAQRTSASAIVIGAGVGALIVAAGIAGWYYANRQPGTPAVPAVAVAPAPAARAPASPVSPAEAPVAPVAPVAADPTAGAPSAAVPAVPAGTQPVPEMVPKMVPEAPAAPVAAVPKPAPEEGAPAVRPEPKPRAVAPRAPRAERPAAAPVLAAVDRAAVPPAQGAGLTSRQQGENAYRRALGALQEGRVTEAIATLEQAVELYPRHEAARQTLVGLLLESSRPGEAMRHAQLALELDANQPQLAMVLARLQLERGGPADETLLRSLPHAAGNADYIAFLAGVLQKQGRHREAAQQYEAALRLRPANGVWWMGLGISYQAENLRTNAHDAYVKAREAGLSPELHAFVERRLAQLR